MREVARADQTNARAVTLCAPLSSSSGDQPRGGRKDAARVEVRSATSLATSTSGPLTTPGPLPLRSDDTHAASPRPVFALLFFFRSPDQPIENL